MSRPPLRVVAMADTHLFHEGLRVPDGDVLVHAGDACRGGAVRELAHFADWFRAQPHRHKVFVAGNHDWAFVREPDGARELLGPDVIYLEDDGCEIEGRRFWGSPWQPEFCDWAFNLPRGPALAERWALIPKGLDVLITHGPPRGIGDDTGRDRAGCDDLLARVEIVRPRLHLFGHIHEDGGAWRHGATWFVNCTSWECEVQPWVIDLGADVTVTPPGE